MRAELENSQNTDGGWGIRPAAPSWTEPTALAALALANARGIAWLAQTQLPDGGWPPNPNVSRSTWVTAIVALLPRKLLGDQRHDLAVQNLLSAMEQRPSTSERVRRWMLGIKPANGPDARGWSWFPGSASWLTPTAMSIIALRRAGAGPDPAAIEYLWQRQCADGGWNHGSSHALGYEAPSYAETTGLALVALTGTGGPRLDRAIEAASRHADTPLTTEGASWLRIALHLHGCNPGAVNFAAPPRTTIDRALTLLADRTVAGEKLW